MLNPFASDFKPATYSSEPKIDPPVPTKKPNEATKKKLETKKTADASKKKKESKKAKKPNTESVNKRKDSHSSSSKKTDKSRVTTVSQTESIFSQESPFIAIEAAIDPIHRIDYQINNNTTPNARRQSLTIKKKFEHGYERYIDWIDRSLGCYDTVTVVGMENAIVDVISIVTILYDRKIAAHDDIETFTMNPGNGKMTSCIQVKLHPFF